MSRRGERRPCKKKKPPRAAQDLRDANCIQRSRTLGPVDDALVLGDGDWVMLALKLPTEPNVFVVPMGKLVCCEDAGRTIPA